MQDQTSDTATNTPFVHINRNAFGFIFVCVFVVLVIMWQCVDVLGGQRLLFKEGCIWTGLCDLPVCPSRVSLEQL